MTDLDEDIPVGSRWLEVKTHRVIVILSRHEAFHNPWWYYKDDPARTPWHCDPADFYLWGRFRRLT